MKRTHQNKKPKILLCLLLTVLLSTVHPFTTYAAEDNSDEEEQILAPYFIVQGAGDEDSPVDNFPLKSTDVITNINGVIAETYVTQTYTNEGDVPINARYVFPTASDVTVHGMKMEIGNQVITAKIKEKEEAKEEYETAKSEGKSASLLEQKRPNVFTMDVANIMPGDTVRIELHYTQLIIPTEGIYEFVFPTVVGPRYAAPSESTSATNDTNAADNNDIDSNNIDSNENIGNDNNNDSDNNNDNNDTNNNDSDSNSSYVPYVPIRHTPKTPDNSNSDSSNDNNSDYSNIHVVSDNGRSNDNSLDDGSSNSEDNYNSDNDSSNDSSSSGNNYNSDDDSSNSGDNYNSDNDSSNSGDNYNSNNDSSNSGDNYNSNDNTNSNSGTNDIDDNNSISDDNYNSNDDNSNSGGSNDINDNNTSDDTNSNNTDDSNSNTDGNSSNTDDNNSNNSGSNDINDTSSSGNDSNDWVSSPYLPEGTTPSGEYHITVNLSTGVPIADLSCKTHEIDVAMDGETKARITLSNPEDYAGNRDFILKYKLTGDSIQSGLVLTSGESENYFMLTVQPPEHYTPEEIPPREYIFVLDVSGSMNGYPLNTAKELINDMVTGLKETDQFNLILFANSTILLSEESLPATSQNIKAATKLVDEQKGGGGTSLLPALNDAIAIPKADDTARSIVIITDGYISNEEEIFDIIEENMDTASFFPFGIGSSVNDYLIKGIAATGMGEAFIVTDSADAAESAKRFRTYIEAPLLTDITVNFDGFDIYDVEPSTPSILYAQKPIVLFGKWRGTPSGTITISGKSGSQSYVQEIPVTDVTVDTQNDALRYLWARTRLDKIAGFGSTRNDSSTKEEITRLGLEYNMTTPYTSFIAVVDTIRNTEGESTDVDQALPLPLHVTNLAVGGGYTAYSEPGDILFLLLLSCLALTGVVKIIKFSRKSAIHGQK